MFEKKRKMREAAAFDGEAPFLDQPGPGAHTQALTRLREGARAAAADTPVIDDAQFGAFMAGIQAAVSEEPAPRRFHLWTAASLALAALVIVVALLSVLHTGPGTVQANTVESATTELNGATVDWYDNKEGVTTVWVKTSGPDVW